MYLKITYGWFAEENRGKTKELDKALQDCLNNTLVHKRNNVPDEPRSRLPGPCKWLICREGQGIGRTNRGYEKNHSRPAYAGEACGPDGRGDQSQDGFIRSHPPEGKPFFHLTLSK